MIEDIKTFKKAAKTANDVIFRRYEDGEKTVSQIELAHRSEKSWEFDRYTCFPAESIIYDYGEKSHGQKYFAMIFFCQHDIEWQTFLDCLKPTDTIKLVWTISNDNDLLRDAKLHCDSLSTRIIRNDKKHLQFRLVSSVAKNNSARMVHY